jgi:hypothetical protein
MTDLKKFKSQEIDRIKGKQYSEVTYVYSRKDNKTFNVSNVKQIYNSVIKDLKKNKVYDKAKILVGVTNGMSNYWTLKGFKEDEVRIDDYQEYFRSSVNAKDKFEQVAKIRITVAII